MQVSIENTSDLSRKMSIVVPASDIDKMAQEKYEQIQKTVKMAGFRAGHVPMDVVKKQHGERVMSEITEQVISSSLAQAMIDNKVRPATQPHMDTGAGLPAEGQDYAYSVTFDIYPDIKPQKYTSIKLTREVAEPTDEMVTELLERLSSMRKNYKKKSGKAVMGDRITMDAEGFVKGEDKPFEGGTLKSFQVELGSGQLIPGFEDGLVDLKEKDTKDVEVTFPKEYHSKELAGKDAVFKVTVLRVEETEAVAFDDEFAKTFGEKSMDDLRAKVREQLASDLEQASQQRLKRELFDKLDKNNQFALPDGLVENEFKSIWQAQEQDLKSKGLDFSVLGKSEDELRVEYRELAARRVRLGLLLAEIGKTEKLQVEEAEIKAEIEAIAARNPEQADQVRTFYAEPQRQNELAGPLFEKKVSDWVLENCEVKEKKAKPEELVQELQ